MYGFLAMATLFAICGFAYDVLLGTSTHSRIRTFYIFALYVFVIACSCIHLHLIDLR